MSLLVHFQVPLLRKLPITNVAFVRLLSRMQSLMAFQCPLLAKPLVAYIARVRFFTIVHLTVLVQVAAQVKALVTHGTRERFFPRVNTPMVDAPGPPREPLKAYVTLVGFLTGMHLHVFDECPLFREFLLTVRAGERFFAGMSARVSCKRALTREVLFAYGALVWAFRGAEFDLPIEGAVGFELLVVDAPDEVVLPYCSFGE